MNIKVGDIVQMSETDALRDKFQLALVLIESIVGSYISYYYIGTDIKSDRSFGDFKDIMLNKVGEVV
jgi:hypothetical protein